MSVPKGTKHYFERASEAETLFFADPPAALRRLVGRYYHSALAHPQGNNFMYPLMRTLTEHLPLVERLAGSDGTQDWDRITFQARSSLMAFVQITKPDYRAASHHELMARRIQAAAESDGGRLYIGLPPRHGKSELCSIRLPAWFLGSNPSLNVMLVCHTQELASQFSRMTRDFVFGDPLYRLIFPDVQPDPNRQAMADWRTTRGGGLRAVGVGGNISGHGADLLVIDDPHKDDDWLNDEALRRVYDWYASAARTRLSPTASVVLLMTRWHTQDLAGRLLAQTEDGDRFDQVVLPALAGPDDPLGRVEGAALWPERFDLESLSKQRAVSEEVFQSLYQQNPQAFSDYLFNASDIVWVESLPLSGSEFWTGDFAVTMNERSDYTVLARWNYSQGVLTLLEAHRYRADVAGSLDHISELVARHPESRLYLPRDPVERTIVQVLGPRFPTWGFPSVKMGNVDKRVKAQSAATLARAGLLHFTRGALGVEHFVSELLEFPNGDYDDCVDALSVAARVVATWGGADYIA